MNNLKTGLALGSSLLMVGGVIAGCGTSNNTTNAANGTGNATSSTTNTATNTTSGGAVNFSNASGTIVWAAPPITQTGLKKTLIAAFEKKYPNIKVTLQQQNNNTDTNKASLTTAISGGSATPDVYMGDVTWPAQFANSQLAMPLDGKLPASFFNRFSKGLVDGATYKGHIYAAPFFADTAFLYYRKDLLQKAGLPVPTSWAQVQSEAETLQKKGLVKYGFVWQGADYEGLTCDFMEYLSDAGGQVLSNGKANINTPQAAKALNFMTGLIKSGVTPKAVDTFQENQSANVFEQGNAAFIRNWTYEWNESQTSSASKVKGKVGVTTLPTFSGGPGYSTVGGWDLYVNPHTKNLPADLAFINWMTGTQAQDILAKQFGELPTNASVANDPSLKSISPVFGLLSKIHFVSRPVQSPNYAKISQAIYSNVNQALSGSISTSTALQNAQQQIQSALSSNGL